MLSESEKDSVDRVGFCMQLTRSGTLANVVTMFVAATGGGCAGRKAQKKLADYVVECRNAVKKRGAFADKTIAEMKGSG